MKFNITCCQFGPLQDTQGTPQVSPRPSFKALNLEPRWSPDPPAWREDGPKAPQLGAKNGSWVRLGRFLEPTWPPDLSTWRQDVSQTSDLVPRWLPDPSTRTQDGLQAPQLGAIKVSNLRGSSFENKQIAWEVLQKWLLR